MRLLKAAVMKNQQLASAAARGEGVDKAIFGSLLMCSSSMSIDFELLTRFSRCQTTLNA